LPAAPRHGSRPGSASQGAAGQAPAAITATEAKEVKHMQGARSQQQQVTGMH
jgi:hypothetical protein